MSSQPYRILFVEDDPSQADALSALLGSNEDSLQIVRARSLELGSPVLCAESVDALLLGGRKLDEAVSNVAKIHAHLESLPIFVLVPQDIESFEEHFLAAGATDVLFTETLTPALLKMALDHALERRRLNNLLRQSETCSEELFENARDIIFTMDLEGNFTSLNKSAEAVMGWSREEARQVNLKQIVPPEHLNLCKQIMGHILNDDSPQQFEICLLRKDGKKVLLEISVRLIFSDGKKKGIQGIARDVTERRNLENMVRQSQKLDAIGRLSGSIAHDFNNLLCVISGHAELLSERLNTNHPGTQNVNQIKKAVDSASSLVRQLLAFSRKQVFHPQIIDLNVIVLETEKLLGRLVGEQIEFLSSLQPLLGNVCVDPVQIEQVIVNLVLNARDAMPQGGKLTLETRNVDLTEDSRSRHAIVPAGKYVELAVTDNGCGMDEETQNRIFEPFYTTKESGKGTGLGLATVYGIVKQSGGSIAVYSEPGHGTSFKIYLPRIDATPNEIVAPKLQQESRQGSETIMLVENSEPLRALAKEFLRSSGYVVLDAESGREAIRIARAFGGPIHLLLTDVIMPGMDGKQLAAQFATFRPATKVLYMSGYSDEGIVHSGLLNAEKVFLEKPFTRDVLLRKVRRILDDRPSPLDGSRAGEPMPVQSKTN
ncbi:MAG TPA: PAS domain S-box protein [Candidatus Acidoferrum sp.]|nr:PAS domain S-box protein [Candidatus Acidoferrum sp.]